MHPQKKTKIVSTISEQRGDEAFIRSLYEAGVDCFRLNTAHLSVGAAVQVVENIRRVSERLSIMIDTKGPEIRTTPVAAPIRLSTGAIIHIAANAEQLSTPECINVGYPRFVRDVNVGRTVLIDDGEVALEVVGRDAEGLECRVLNDAVLGGRKTVNVPSVRFDLPALTDKDRAFIQFAIEHEVDFIAHSFVRQKEDILAVQRLLDERHSPIQIIAKIENQEGVDNVDEILDHAHGIMVARGDLGIEVPYERLPGIQKAIIDKCIERRKPVIIATQMLHTMIHSPRPTRAEVSDVASAIFTRADAIMLSGETAVGEYPVEAVKTMSRIALEVEKARGDMHDIPLRVLSSEISAYLSRAAVEGAIKLDAEVIIADSETGKTIRNMAGYRGRKVIHAVCYYPQVMRQMSLLFGVHAHLLDSSQRSAFVGPVLNELLGRGLVELEDLIVVVGGTFGFKHGKSFIEISSARNLIEAMNS